MGKFDCLSEFVEHFENKPLIGGDSGLLKVSLIAHLFTGSHAIEPVAFDF